MNIGVDLGGTNLRVAMADENGQLCHVLKTDTPAAAGPEAIVRCISEQVQRLPDWQIADSIGIGAPGGADIKRGTILMASNLPGMDGYPLVNMLKELLHKPIYLENDANAACLGEALAGAGKGFDSMVYLTISTGIGGGIYDHGRLLRGGRGFAGEFGCISVNPCYDSRNQLPPGAVESEASGTVLIEKASALLGRKVAHAGEVFSQAAAGNAAMQKIADDFVLHIAVTLSNLACVLDPQLFVLGGGVMNSSDLFLSSLQQRFRDMVHEIYKDIPIRMSALSDAGLIGAAMLSRMESFH